MTLAILCSGQGNQNAEMFALTGDCPEATHLFDSAAALLNHEDPRELVRSGSGGDLFENRTAQILCTLQALAAVCTLQPSIPSRSIFAGYSVGEVAAWGAAGIFDQIDTLKLVAERAEQMSAASVPGDGLLFVRGLDYQAISNLCEKLGGGIAIINPDDAFVVGGGKEFLTAITRAAMNAHATRITRLPIEVASHTALLNRVSLKFRSTLDELPKRFPPSGEAKLLSGVDGAKVYQLDRGLDKLAAQISHTVKWADNLQACVENGASAFLELGPGRALSEMAGASYKDIPSRSLEDFKTIDGVNAWISKWAAR